MENEFVHGDTGGVEQQAPPWKPIGKVLRRVAGVLVEKAKTTPDIYPMTINAITTASNQKSNRSPQMQLEHDDVEEALDELREMGAVVEVHGDGRKPKFKHRLYEWLGVEKVEMAIMAELLLRGGQTLGDLRARASRMEKIEGQSELKPLVQELVKKGLVIELTPPGRGQMVTHGLFMPEELAKIERSLNQVVESSSASEAVEATSSSGSVLKTLPEMDQRLDELTQEVEMLKAQVAEIMKMLND
jgi:uncharacterized protein YceH (UPF0502 family)